MKYEIERLKGEVKATVTMSAEEWDINVENAYNKTKHKYAVPGFRKGKVPKKVIEKNYGAGVFFDDAFNAAASESYGKILDENADIVPVDSPKVDIKKFPDEGKGFEYVITVTTMPEVKLGQYKGLEIEKSDYPVTEADIDNEIKSAQERASRLVKVTDRDVKDGDTVNLDYSGSVNGVKFDGGTAEKQTLVIGSNSFIPGFEEQMIGMKIGETKDLKVKFPDEYHSEELKGKDAVFTVTVNEISVKELPALDDTFAKDTSKFDTFAEYKADVEARLKSQNESKADNENKNRIIETVAANASVDVPDCMIEEELDYMLKDFEYRLMYMYQGMKLEDYFKYTNSSAEDFKKERRSDAEKSVKTRLVMQQIVKDEKLEVSEADLDEQIKKVAENSGKGFDDYKATLNDQRIAGMKNDILVNKMFDMLNSANIFKVKAEKVEKSAKKPAVKKKAE